MNYRHILPGFGVIPQDITRDSMSGVVGVAYNLAAQQSKQAADAELIGLGKGTQILPEGLRITTVMPWKRAVLGPVDLSYLAPVAAKLAGRPSADIQHVYSNPYLLWPWVGRATRRIIHYQTPIGAVPPNYVKVLRRADAVICCSAFIRDQLLAHADYPRTHVHVVPNGVDLARFSTADAAAYRHSLGIPANALVVLFAGQVNEAKGLLHLVHACSILAPEQPVHLLVAGSSGLWTNLEQPGTALSPYEQQVHQAARSIPTTFLGKVPYAAMPSAYAAADIFVCPSEWEEPFGMVILEAMAAGLPVVASAVGGIPEVVQPGKTGELVAPANPAALAAALRPILADRAYRERLSSNGKTYVQNFSWKHIAQQVQAIYDEVLGTKKSKEGRAYANAIEK
jgi:glycosyltransferase involved in cell wall biosynthesis